jgi:hypothetical protein
MYIKVIYVEHDLHILGSAKLILGKWNKSSHSNFCQAEFGRLGLIVDL